METFQAVLLIVGGLALLLIVFILVRNARQKPAALAQPIGAEQAPPPIEAPAAPPIPSLEFVVENGPPLVFTINKPMLTLGRGEDNDVLVPAAIPNADTVSLHHAQLRRDKDKYIVRDLGSRNGLKVNDRYTMQNLLEDGDRLSFGAVEAIFHQPGGGVA